MKILNLYACLGGNRYKWGDQHDITAVEWDEELARMYQERFPNDKVIVADAHQYLLNHYKEFDFIWSSPPCPTHSKLRLGLKNNKAFTPKFPDMKLYEEIIFLKHFFSGKFVIENVSSYYQPLIEPFNIGRHYYWSNFIIPYFSVRKFEGFTKTKNEKILLCDFHKIDINFLESYLGKQDKRKLVRNMVDYEVGKTILDIAMDIIKKKDEQQISLL